MKVALSHGPKMSIVDLASGCETVLPSLDALRGDDRLCYFWAGHAAGEWLIGGGLWTRDGFSTNTWSLEGPTGSWAEGPVTPTASSGGAAVSVGDAVYVIGGYAARGQFKSGPPSLQRRLLDADGAPASRKASLCYSAKRPHSRVFYG